MKRLFLILAALLYLAPSVRAGSCTSPCVQTVSGYGTGPVVVNFASNVTAGNIVIVWVANAGPTASTADGGSDPLTQGPTDGAYGVRVDYTCNSVGGYKNVSSANDGRNTPIIAVEIANPNHASDCIDTYVGVNHDAATTLTISSVDSIYAHGTSAAVLGFFGCYSCVNPTWTAGTGYTARETPHGSPSGLLEDLDTNTSLSGAISATASENGSGNITGVLIVIHPASENTNCTSPCKQTAAGWSSTSPFTYNFANSVTAGHTVVVWVASNIATTSCPTVADGASDSFTLGVDDHLSGICIYHKVNSAGGFTSITATSAGTGTIWMSAAADLNLSGSAVLDQSGTHTTSGSTAYTVSTGSAVTQKDWVGAWFFSTGGTPNGVNPGTGYTARQRLHPLAGFNSITAIFEDGDTLPTSGVQTATATGTASGNGAFGVIAAYGPIITNAKRPQLTGWN